MHHLMPDNHRPYIADYRRAIRNRLWMPNDTLLPRFNGAAFSLTIAAILAIATPTLLAFNLPPSSTFFNQAAAFVGWGAFIAVLGAVAPWPGSVVRRKLLLLLIPLLFLVIAAAVSTQVTGLPLALSISALGAILAAAITVIAGAASRQSDHSLTIFRGVSIALVVAGIAGTIIGSIQVFLPDWTDGTWLAVVSADGRASSNLRQPNHLSSILVWSLVTAAWLWQSRTVNAAVCATLSVLFVFGIVLTGSRTGILDVAILAVWGVLDRKMSRSLRLSLLIAPILYAFFWWGLAQWAHSTHHVFGGEARMGTQGDISSSRYAIWSDTLSLIAQHPWFGVGFGEFNFAWSLTPFPHRPVAFFDHTHNLALQFAVELGVPAAALIMASLMAALCLAFVASMRAVQPASSAIRAAFMIVLTIGVHSMLEYPLWYAYFLLPTAFAFGFCLGDGADAAGSTRGASDAWNSLALAAMGLVLLLGGVSSVVDYRRVVAIFSSDEAEPLIERINAGKHSLLFDYHADYAAVTTASRPSELMSSFKTSTHNLLDTRLMIAWAKAFAERGDLERAKHIAQRLREFRNEDSKEFFAACDENAPKKPFQCEAPTRALDYQDFR